MEAQAFSVKRAEVEFHNFASMGEPDRVIADYVEDNQRRGGIMRKHREFAGSLTPFLEIGANVGHTSYLLANEFGADGFALDISADALRYGMVLPDKWGMSRHPVRLAGDAAHLPFADESLHFVCAFQMLSQFMNIESVFLEVKRVLVPGGVFFFSEEPLRRMLTAGLYRAPYYDTMKPWERKLHDAGLLGYIVRDVIGAHQEESFGIRQNHSMGLSNWDALIRKHFAAQEYEIFPRVTGWGERLVAGSVNSTWRTAKLLGGTLSAFCRKAGSLPADRTDSLAHFEQLLKCPDCGQALARDSVQSLRCDACKYQAAFEGGVYNLLPSQERNELYPGDREDIVDFSLAGHERYLRRGFYELEGQFGNKYRWVGAEAVATLKIVNPGPQRLRIRGHASEQMFQQGKPAQVEAVVNGQRVHEWTLERPGLFLLETDLPAAPTYELTLKIGPTWQAPPDVRVFTVNLSMIRLVPAINE